MLLAHSNSSSYFHTEPSVPWEPAHAIVFDNAALTLKLFSGVPCNIHNTARSENWPPTATTYPSQPPTTPHPQNLSNKFQRSNRPVITHNALQFRTWQSNIAKPLLPSIRWHSLSWPRRITLLPTMTYQCQQLHLSVFVTYVTTTFFLPPLLWFLRHIRYHVLSCIFLPIRKVQEAV
jgi:hypothetical protein